MSEAGAPKLSGAFVGVIEALAWIRTRDADLAQSLRLKTLNICALAIVFWRDECRSPVYDRGEAEERLLAALRNGDVHAIGRPGNLFEPTGDRRPIATWEWQELRFSETLDGHAVARTEDGRAEFEAWHRVQLDTAAVLRLFPVQSEGPREPVDTSQKHESTQSPTRTGLPGRPTKSRDLWEPEFLRRCNARTIAATLTAEAEFLVNWLKTNHGGSAMPTAKTVKNAIRHRYREAGN